MNRLKLISITALFLFSAGALLPGQEKIDFEKQVRPIFEQHCIECHGDREPESGLRLTHRRHALTDADSGSAVIVPGKAAESPLLHRITSDDDTEQMPPEGDRLSNKETELIRQWIDEGAIWPESKTKKHWAYIAPIQPEVPVTNNRSWAKTEIDAFVMAKLEANQLKPSPTEDPARLIRRVYLALIGLPPTTEQVAEFVDNPTRDTYESIVDRLLASPRYGERWAQPWLDLARYADSNGYQADQLRDSWAYRDWVIRSINNDQPIDQFTIEQLAGDLIPDATIDQKIATGFHRGVTCNVEAGVHPEQNRVNQIFDRVNTTGTVFLGTTIECAQCHNHKYDPFSQDEYYQLFAFFNNTPLEVKLISGVQYDFWGPTTDLPLTPEQAKQKQQLSDALAELESQKTAAVRAAQKTRQQWERRMIAAIQDEPEWMPLKVTDFESSGGESFEILDDQSVLVGGSIPGTTVYTLTTSALSKKKITGIRLEALTHESLPGTGPGRGDEMRSNFILSELTVEAGQDQDFVPIKLTNPTADFSQKNWPVKNAIDGDRKTGWAIAPQFHQSHWATFTFEQPVAATQFRFTLDQNYGRGRTIGRVRILFTSEDVSAIGLPDEIKKILRAEKRTPKQNRRLESWFETDNPELSDLNRKIEAAKKQIDAVTPPKSLVMVEMDEQRDTFKLIRGEYLNPGKPIEAGTPAILHTMSGELPKNRLGLARWITSRDNPLFARVAVNRWWSQLFGQGLLRSEEDFGTQSEPPTHPELLDWLAVELMRNGWSRKKLHRSIVISETFRQSARISEELLQRDPRNELYARGPRLRMPAEMIRDNALQISGLLSAKMGGPPVMPYQPDGIWRAVGRNAPKWNESKNEDRFRRGVYIVWRRAAPYPSLVNFDAPDRAACVVRRPQTNTPLQALTLLNDQAFFEMALALADRTAVADPNASIRETIESMMRSCVSRSPDAEELDQLEALYREQLARFEQNADSAKKLISGIRGYQPASEIDASKLATLTVIANALLNLDETINY